MSEPSKSETLSDAADVTSEPAATGPKKVSVRSVRRESMWRDPVVRVLGIILAFLIVGALLTTVFALLNGTVNLTGAPTDVVSRGVIIAKDNWQTNQSDPAMWLTYFNSLIATKKLPQAKAIYEQAKNAKLAQPSNGGEELMYMQAAIAKADGNTDEAIRLFTACADKLKTSYDAEMKRGGEQNWAMSFGINANWQTAKEQISEMQIAKKDYPGAKTTLNELIARYPTEAGYYIDLGNAKLNLKDKAGAKSAFTTALTYLPNNAEAKAGLEKAK